MKKLTQKQKAFIMLLEEKKGEWIPAWKFVGEIESENFGYLFMSYSVPKRLSEIYHETDFLEREKIKGKSGAKYYHYRIVEDFYDKYYKMSKTYLEILQTITENKKNDK